ncbi:PREDICTED: autophagy-related protein 9B-like [Thamnophis sirtalis]|uniref:Autophagy-related protein 9 n=1 Tax=Thamnophis sirtalis TaxID=35019 RepID=A0A6I9XLE2_9SAUR|nr:PREDICTED: autophagy-related protein 9B-like [Thamnophis sirtalis]
MRIILNTLEYYEAHPEKQLALMFLDVQKAFDNEQLCNCSWQEVQARLISLQREQQLCVHRRELTELDIHHRILRFKNYLVAMVNKSLLPVRFQLPLLGRGVFLTQGLKYNLELLLFWGPGSLFQGKWNLQPQYKRAGARLELARRLERSMLVLGVANLLLCPFILVWQGLYAFFSYTEALKREPGSLGARRWSLYGRLYLRHFNELDHELQARLSRGYKPASKYMNSFANPLLAVVARNVGFFAGSLLAVLIALTVYDEDVLTVQHILTAITLLGLVVTLARIQANSGIIFLLVMAATFWLYRLVKVLCSLLGYWEIRSFYTKALKIPSASVYQQAENGKTELSLVHFAIANPHWQPPPESSLFIGHLKEKVQQDASHAQRLLAEGPLATSLLSDEGPGPVSDALLASVLTHPVLTERRLVAQPGSTASVTASILASLSSSLPPRHRSRPGEASLSHSQSPLLENSAAPRPAPLSRSVLLSELALAEMSLHALYMHELHQQQTAARLTLQPSAQTASPRRLFDSRSQDRSLEVWEEESDETQQPQQPEKS